jgi:hypothetical protein
MRNFIVFTPHECDQAKLEEMDGTRSGYEGRKIHTGFWSVNLNKKKTWKT